MERAYYVTTPIYYINGNPHIGHAYTSVAADVVARTARTYRPAFFLTGSDEHGQKVANAAAAAGKTPQEWCDELVPRWKALLKTYHVEYDDFIRTTEPRHMEIVERVFERLRETGDIYRGKYEGWYCVADETFWPEKKIVDGRCPTCGRPVEWISEEDWFFRLTAYRDRLIEHYERFPGWVQPRGVYNEMLAFLREGLDDLSVSRTNLEWGVPIRDGGVVYVWLDALLNYITAIGWGRDETRFRTYWPAQLQLMAKDIARFHTIIWPAILWALGEAAPELVFAHGWITIDGQKMSKSLGNTVDPFVLAERFGADAIRYFLLREAPFGSDFSYSEEKIAQRHNSDLANDLGNLLQRTLAMLGRYRDGIVPEGRAADSELARRFAPLPVVTRERFLDLRFREGLEGVWEMITALNQTIDERKPWTLHKENRTDELNAVLYDLCEGLRWVAVLLHPVMPERMHEMWEQLGLPGRIDEDWSSSLHTWGGLAPLTQTALAAPLFPKLDPVATS